MRDKKNDSYNSILLTITKREDSEIFDTKPNGLSLTELMARPIEIIEARTSRENGCSTRFFHHEKRSIPIEADGEYPVRYTTHGSTNSVNYRACSGLDICACMYVLAYTHTGAYTHETRY